MKIVVTGTVGLDKGEYLDEVAHLARQDGVGVEVCHVGRRMYAEAPDVAPGRILDLPLSRLHSLRRSVFKDIFNIAARNEHVIINTHAAFRWRHGLFPAFDFDHLARFNADMYVCLMDNVDAVHCRLLREHQIDHTLKDLLVWREEELLATEMMMRGCALGRKGEPARFYVLAVGSEQITKNMLCRLILTPQSPRAYLSFPMTHVAGLAGVEAEIQRFRAAMAELFIVFDPADVDEHRLVLAAMGAAQEGLKVMELDVLSEKIAFEVGDVLQVAGDINAQIYARDFQLIDQADMIISYIPELPDGKPGLSSGVERELQHAHEATREVYVIWPSRMSPSPFITETATKVFATLAEAVAFLTDRYNVAKLSP